jgi:DNA-binding GntR family transcriptional regulator
MALGFQGSSMLDVSEKNDSNGKQSGSMRVYTALKEDILRVKLAPGVPLDEVGLSERFGMSRSPIREALVRLSSERLVVILPNRSTIVAPMDVQRIPEFLEALDLQQRVVTRLAALHRSPADLEEIVKGQKAFEAGVAHSIKTGDSLQLIETNYEFHMAIAAAAHNQYFMDFYRRVLEEGRRMLHFHFEYSTMEPGLPADNLCRDHTQMVEAIKAGDAAAAEHIAHRHAIQFRGRFIQYLDRNLTRIMEIEYKDQSNAGRLDNQQAAPLKTRGQASGNYRTSRGTGARRR